MKGEKTLTPLAFSCSPWMLSLQQSRKINLMHIVKKTVAMNLTAERVEPPLPPLPPSIMVLCNAEIEAATMVLHLPPGRLNKLQSHRRARSHTVKENLETTNSPSQRIIATSVLRHRRASSAGANTLMRPVNGRSNGPGMIPALPILPQHILPLRQIAESSQRRPAVVARPETYFWLSTTIKAILSLWMKLGIDPSCEKSGHTKTRANSFQIHSISFQN